MESVKNLDEKSQVLLDTLKKVASRTLDRKRRLGHYAVLWKDGKPLLQGEDAPAADGESRSFPEPGR